MHLVTSNARKLAEFKRFGLPIEAKPGPDLAEVMGTPIEVVLYKAATAGAGAVVEDTILEVDGEPVVDVRYRLDQLGASDAAAWITMLGHNDGKTIRIYRGFVAGKLVLPGRGPQDAFGFDRHFQPRGSVLTLAELEEAGLKDDFSARKRAVLALVNGQCLLCQRLDTLPRWEGAYQPAA